MDNFDILQPGPWFGPRPTQSEIEKQIVSEDAKARLIAISNLFKAGIFSERPQLEAFILDCDDAQVKRQAIRLYCYTSRHQDINFFGKILETADHDDVFSIIIYAPHTLSPQIVPYLFTLLEEYDDTPVEQDILSSINMIFPFEYDGEKVEINDLTPRLSGFGKGLNLTNYYYDGAEAFAGDLTKKLIQAAANARYEKSAFPLTDAPTLLSMWSGIKCPLFYGDMVSDIEFESIMEYAKSIATMNWIRGNKYFYGHQISN